MTQAEARERVARGAALLDENRPGWATVIDTGKLDLRHDCACILGQLEGSYNAAEKAWFPVQRRRPKWFGLSESVEPDTNASRAIAVSFGFHNKRTKTAYSNYEFRLLKDAWIEAIADRLVPTAESALSVGAVDPQGEKVTEGPRA